MIKTTQSLANTTLTLEPVDVDMLASDCKSWFMRWTETDYEAVKNSARGILSEAEYNYGLAKPDHKQALQHWCSRIVVRQALSEFMNFCCGPSEWELVKLPSGKMVLGENSLAPSDLDFSLTHVEGMAVCTIAIGSLVGVDLEHANRRFKTSTIMKGTTFSTAEVKTLRMTGVRQRSDLALKFWTLKEACSKTIGVGMQMPFSDLQFQVSGEGECEVRKINSPKPLKDWKVSQQLFQNGYFLSIAIASPVEDVKLAA